MGDRLRIVSLNTWKCDGAYRDRVGWMADGLAALAPNVVFLQEAFVCRDAGAEADTAAALARALGHRAEVLVGRVKRRRFEGDDRASESNLAILAADPLTDVARAPLPPCPADTDRWILSGTLDWSGLPVRVANTHFTHVHGAAGDTARAAQARALADLGTPPRGGISVLGGDLNALWESPALTPLRALADRLVPRSDTVDGTLQGERPGPRPASRTIDHLVARAGKAAPPMVHSSRFAALNTPVAPTGAYPSDHAAVVIDLHR